MVSLDKLVHMPDEWVRRPSKSRVHAVFNQSEGVVSTIFDMIITDSVTTGVSF